MRLPRPGQPGRFDWAGGADTINLSNNGTVAEGGLKCLRRCCMAGLWNTDKRADPLGALPTARSKERAE